MAGVDAGAVAAAQHGGLVFVRISVGGQGDAVFAKGARHDAVDELWAAGVGGVPSHCSGAM